MNRRELTWLERAFIASSRFSADHLGLGYHIDFDEEIVRQHGIGGFLTWAKASWPLTVELEKHFGTEQHHVLSAFASFFNGCDYCSWGHLFALNLVHFDRTGTLYPLDEREVAALMQLSDQDVMAELERRLADFPAHLALVKRQQALRGVDAVATDPEDRLLQRSLALFDWINECSIVTPSPAPPLGKVAKKKKLIAAYNEARAPGRAARQG